MYNVRIMRVRACSLSLYPLLPLLSSSTDVLLTPLSTSPQSLSSELFKSWTHIANRQAGVTTEAGPT